MEALRWILLGAGVLFVLIVYLLGRNRRSNAFASSEPESEELPEFSANSWADVDEDMADVHIRAREPNDVSLNRFYDDEDNSDDVSAVDADISEHDAQSSDDKKSAASDIIVLTIIARSEEGLHGDQINSAVLANKLKFGHMNIFHRMGDDGKPLFSVANMVEPGSFDPATIHEMRTPGITFFMQLSVFGGASNALSDLLQCAYKVSEILGADLCNKNRQLLTEKEAENLREQAQSYDSE